MEGATSIAVDTTRADVRRWYGVRIHALDARTYLDRLHGAIALTCPCGVLVYFPTGASIPDQTQAHPCGDALHVTVKVD